MDYRGLNHRFVSLSDAARIRSGSCHGCDSSRIKVDEHN